MDKTWKCILVIAVLLLIYLVCINQGGRIGKLRPGRAKFAVYLYGRLHEQ